MSGLAVARATAGAAPDVSIGRGLRPFFAAWLLVVYTAWAGIMRPSQYAWTCRHEHIVGRSLAWATVGVLALNLGLHALFTLGRRSLPMEA